MKVWDKKEKLVTVLNLKIYLTVFIIILPVFAWLFYYYPSYKSLKNVKVENQRLKEDIIQYKQYLNTVKGKEKLVDLEESFNELEYLTFCGSQLEEVFTMMEEALLFLNFKHQEIELGGVVFPQESSYGFMILDITFEGTQEDLLSYINNIEANFPGLMVEKLSFQKGTPMLYCNLRVKGTLRF
ncbi:hypothetical protein [Candidatus Contubernalis alkaliaceticus]|uniref:hypothetical protein n=1 Tax=Candidatus Contubernalis alkaliaceticus TaxID=338645 RepID=UPI001F4C14D6|nr:hypothetical protein [Candidatus Contubernalis alkalaceticus]UNC92568.1 hypothetical protein HUE98_10935 [Candidatus Contubernalis alkalaceticus]